MKPFTVLLPRLFFIGPVSVSLRLLQEPPDGAQVLPQRAVLWAGVLLPPKQLAQPTLEKRQRQTWRKKAVVKERSGDGTINRTQRSFSSDITHAAVFHFASYINGAKSGNCVSFHSFMIDHQQERG